MRAEDTTTSFTAAISLSESSTAMEAYEATRIVYSKVQSVDPENVSKIMGFFLLQENSEHEMFRLAAGSDVLLHSMVIQAKNELGLSSWGGLHLPTELPDLQISRHKRSSGGQFFPQISTGLSPKLSQVSPHRYSFPVHNQLSPNFTTQVQMQKAFQAQHRLQPNVTSYPDNELIGSHHLIAVNDQVALHLKLAANDHKGKHSFHDQFTIQDFVPSINNAMEASTPRGSTVFPNDHFCPKTLANIGRVAADNTFEQLTLENLILPDQASTLVWKPCMYFARGYCKHGSSCRFLHGRSKDSSGSASPASAGQRENSTDESLGTPLSLDRLELELQELLHFSQTPVSIASLPQLYYERYGKVLQVEGYLTESQRHGKVAYSLTKLLARFRSTVSLIDRPHGQHAIVLAEDVHKFTFDRSNLEEIIPGSRQIYLTFPSESSFIEEDVSEHFRAYGPVQDVRIPYQQKRMFGFVTFVYSETVNTILSEGNPHYICGARVLVKPYREKGRNGDKKQVERAEPSRYSFSQRNYDCSAFNIRKNGIMSTQCDIKSLIELERRRLTEMQMADIMQRHVEAHIANLSVLGQKNQNHVTKDDETNDSRQEEESSPTEERNSLMLPKNLFSSPLNFGKDNLYGLPEDIDNLSLEETIEFSHAATPVAQPLVPKTIFTI